MDKEDYRKPSGDEDEVVFSQQEEGAASTGPPGENGWREDTEIRMSTSWLTMC